MSPIFESLVAEHFPASDRPERRVPSVCDLRGPTIPSSARATAVKTAQEVLQRLSKKHGPKVQA